MSAMGLIKLVEYHPVYVEEHDNQKARAVNLVFHSRGNEYVGGTSGGDVESMIPVREINSRKHQRVVLEAGGRKIRYLKEGDPPSTEKLARLTVVIPSPWLLARMKNT